MVTFSMAGFLVISAQVLIVLITGLVALPASSFTFSVGDPGVPFNGGISAPFPRIGLSGEELRIDFSEPIEPSDAAVVLENIESTELVIVLFPLDDSLPPFGLKGVDGRMGNGTRLGRLTRLFNCWVPPLESL